MPGLPPWRRPCSFSSGLHEPYSGYYKNYVDYYGGMDYLDGKLLLNTTDLEVAPIRELAQETKAVIEKVNYSLNQLAMKIVELGNAGRINGYGGPLAVLPRHNRGGLTAWTDKYQVQGAYPRRRCWRNWGLRRHAQPD